MTTVGASGNNNSIYNNLSIKPATITAVDNTRVAQKPVKIPSQDYSSTASYAKAGSAPTSISFEPGAGTTRSAQEIVSSLSKLKNSPAKFAAEVNKILKNNDERATLIKHFGLDSAENKKNLGIAMFLEAGEGLNKDHMMPVGAVILNRAIANNLALAASGKTQKFNISDIIRERSQFAIKSSYNSALAGGRKDAVNHGSSQTVQNMVGDLLKGQVGKNSNAETAFFFQRATLRNQSFRAGSHSFSPTPSSVQYVNGNYLVGAGGNGYYKK